MKVTDKKFLNVHQTIGPLTVSTTVTSSAKEEGSTKSEKLLVSLPSLVAWKCLGTPHMRRHIMHGTFKHYHTRNRTTFLIITRCIAISLNEKECFSHLLPPTPASPAGRSSVLLVTVENFCASKCEYIILVKSVLSCRR